MQAPAWTDFLQCSICTNKFNGTDVVPISLSCSHTLCIKCLGKLNMRVCPYDKTTISADIESLPPNTALLQLLGHKLEGTGVDSLHVTFPAESNREEYLAARNAIEETALFLLPLAEQGVTSAVSHLTRPMLKKLVTVVSSQILETEGRARALRAARSVADRTVTELLVQHQNQQQISSLLWTAVRNRGCQFLGPVMQEEALKLILKVLEDGAFMSRKTIVLFVVQRLQNDFPQASKTCVGHVVQLLYRASCFNVKKQEDDSSLMQLKEDFRSYESLRREHDAQIIRVAMEAGLRISPEQWSSLLYGDHKHKSDMQSIIDKLISQGAASSGLSELSVAIRRTQDPYNLAEILLPHLEVLLKIDINVDKNSDLITWWTFAECMKALLASLQGFTTYMQIHSGRYKTGMCPNLVKPGGCPKGDKCTYAHSEDERDRYRILARSRKGSKSQTDLKGVGNPMGGGVPGRVGGRHSGDLGPVTVDPAIYHTLGYNGPVFSSQGSGYALTDAYAGMDAYNPQLGYHSSYPAVQLLQAGGRMYQTAPQLISCPPPTGSHRHSGPIETYPVYDTPTMGGVEGGMARHMPPVDQHYATEHSNGPVAGNGNYVSRPVQAYTTKSHGGGLLNEEGGRPGYAVDGYHPVSREGPASVPATASSTDGYVSQTAPVTMPASSIAQSLADVENLKRMRENMKKSLAAGRSHTPLSSSDASAIQGEDGLNYPATPTSAVASTVGPVSSSAGYDGATVTSSVGYHPSSLSEGYHSTSELQPPATFSSASSSVADHSYVGYPGAPSVGGGGAEGGPRETHGNAARVYAAAVTSYQSELANQVAAKLILATSSPEYELARTGYSTTSSSSYRGDAVTSRSSVPRPEGYPRGSSPAVSVGSMSHDMAGGYNTEEKLLDQIQRLQRQLQEKEATIVEQQKHLATGGGHHRHSGPIHHSYSGPLQAVHYSPRNTMQQYPPTLYSPSVGVAQSAAHGSTPDSYYAPYTPPQATAYHHWSGPISGNYSGPLNPSPTGSLSSITPPSTGFIMPTPAGPVMLHATPQQDSMGLDHMLAQYLQASEQVKAASQPVHHFPRGPVHYRHSGEHYRLPPNPAYATPTPPAGQYIYRY